MEINEFDSTHFEPLILGINQFIFNPIFDEHPKTNSLYLDFEDYLSVKLQFAIQNERNRLNYHLSKFIDNNNFSFKTSLHPFQFNRNMKLPKLRAKKKSSFTPFQKIQRIIEQEKNQIYNRKRIKSNCEIQFILKNHSPQNKSQIKINEEKIKNIKLKQIGSYSSFYYTKRDLSKVENLQLKNSTLCNSRNYSQAQLVPFTIEKSKLISSFQSLNPVKSTSKLHIKRIKILKLNFNSTRNRNYI